MSDILCVYYSRTGHTKQVMEEIAAELGAETAELHDGVARSGWRGWLRCGLDTMRKTVPPVKPLHLSKPLSDYRLVILGTPVWAGRCSSVMRSFLKEYGRELHAAAYVVTRSSEGKFEEVYHQMDLYLPEHHLASISLRMDSVGCTFWKDELLRQIQKLLTTL